MLKQLLLSITLLLFYGCGGGTSVEPTPLKTLYFIDSGVNGIDYSCGVRAGVTQQKKVAEELKDGVLFCSKGTITFSLGSLILGSLETYKDGQEIRPQDLMHVSQDNFENEQVLKIALLLQSLDNDGNIEQSINIDEETKKRISQESLTNLSLNDVKSIITSLDKTPIALNDVKKHLIRHSSISYEDAKPMITPFSEDISINSSAGFNIGTISVNQGKAALTSLILSGEDSENFQLNKDGELLLLKKSDKEKTYHLHVTAENIYGTDEENITINIIKGSKLAKVIAGEGVSNSTVKIIELIPTMGGADENLIFTENISSNANFNTHAEELDDDTYYVFEVTGGTLKNTSNKKFNGILRLLTKGSWIKNSNNKIYISTLSEIYYDFIVYSIKNGSLFSTSLSLEERIKLVNKVLLNKDLNYDNIIDTKDLLGFNPLFDKRYLYKTLLNKGIYDTLSTKILKGDKSYIAILFDLAYLNKFKKSDIIKINDSFAYVYAEDSFYIYDLINHKKISSIPIPKNNIDYINSLSEHIKDRNINYKLVSMYLDLNKNRIFLTNLNSNIIAIDIKDYATPQIIMKYKIGVGQHIVDIYNNILFFTKGIPPKLQQNSENIKALNIQDITSPTRINISNLPFIKHIKKTDNKIIGVSLDIDNNIVGNYESNISLKQWELNNLSEKNTIQLLSNQNLLLKYGTIEKTYIYNDYTIYMLLSPGTTISSFNYSLDYFSQTSEIGLYMPIGHLYNRYGNQIYVTGDESWGRKSLSILSTRYDSNELYLYRRFLFKTNFDKNSIYFYDDSFITNNTIIDTNTYLLSQEAYDYLYYSNETDKKIFMNMFLPYNPDEN